MAIKSNPLGVLIAKVRNHGLVAHLGEHLVCTEEVACSSRVRSTIKCDIIQTERVVKHTGFLEAFSFIYIWPISAVG